MKIKIYYHKKMSIFLCIFFMFFMTSCINKDVQIQEKMLPVLAPVDGDLAGAAVAGNRYQIKESPYYPKLDFYNSSPTETVVKHEKFRILQQSSERSCGATCAVMTLHHFKITDVSEDSLDKEMDIRYYDNAQEDGSYGCATPALAKAFRDRGFLVTSSAETQNEDGYSFQTPEAFSIYIQDAFKRNAVIMTENIEWGGHWMVILAYDTMGTETIMDDVLIFADPYDTTDHGQDGYVLKSFARFFYEWFDNGVMPKGQKIQQYVMVEMVKEEN